MTPSPGQLFVLSAPSGAGKTTLTRGLQAADPGLRFSVSFTTRKPRGAETTPGQPRWAGFLGAEGAGGAGSAGGAPAGSTSSGKAQPITRTASASTTAPRGSSLTPTAARAG